MVKELNFKVYETISGDTWDGISFSVYGTEAMVNNLRILNKEFLRLVIFPAGVLIKCPEIEAEKSKELPPWVE